MIKRLKGKRMIKRAKGAKDQKREKKKKCDLNQNSYKFKNKHQGEDCWDLKVMSNFDLNCDTLLTRLGIV